MNNKDSEEKALYNSRIVDNYIKLIRDQYNFIDVDDLLAHAGMSLHQVQDEAHWFTQDQLNRFHKRLKELTGNKDIAREAGRYAASPDALGTMRKYMLGLIGPQIAYELSEKTASKFTKSSVYATNKVGSNKVEIKVTLNRGVQEESFQCESRLGFFDAISTAFNYSLPEIEHPKCLFKGDKECLYLISWQESPHLFWRKARDVVAIFSLISFLFVAIYSSLTVSSLFLTISLSIILSLSFYSERLKTKELNSAVDNLSWSSEKLIEQVNLNYENSLLINDIGQALSKENELDGLLSQVVNVLEHRLDYDRGLILLANSDKTKLVSRAGYGYHFERLSQLMMDDGFHLNKKNSKGVFVNSFNKKKPFLVNDLDEIKDDLSTRSLDFAKRMGAKSFICCPIVYEGESLGVLAVDNIETKKPLVQSDINLLMGIAPQIAVGINNIKLVEARLKQFQAILQALVASTEARDPITAGHSERVTDYAVGICKELGLPTDYTDMISVAASLHDYGKIGVDDSILKKTGKLNDEEYEHIKTHVEKSRKILETVNFEGVYKAVPEIAASHHEKLDGTGYPKGLTEEEIPFGGKIIAVADVFEALTSRRHYRDPMPVNEAFDYLMSNIGFHFDRRCVLALVNYYNNNENAVPYMHKGQFASLSLEEDVLRQNEINAIST
jgi:HD-GYP domain-containing protein (c-di-GMP phosphodiesterase class II)